MVFAQANRVGSFNTQPPEGGWLGVAGYFMAQTWFQHTAARRRLVADYSAVRRAAGFQHTAARRRLA